MNKMTHEKKCRVCAQVGLVMTGGVGRVEQALLGGTSFPRADAPRTRALTTRALTTHARARARALRTQHTPARVSLNSLTSALIITHSLMIMITHS